MRRAATPTLPTTRLRATVTGAVLAVLAALLTALAPPAAAQQTAVLGGDPLYGSHGYTCRVGFNVERGVDPYGLMLGHCAAPAGTTWYADPARTVLVGQTSEATFPAGDRALVRYTNDALTYPGEINLGDGRTQPITGVSLPTIGSEVCWVSGSGGGLLCSVVQALNVSVHYPEGTVDGLIQLSGCAEPGDVGKPAFAGSGGVGIVQGGTGNCSSGGVTYLLPLEPVLSEYGVNLR